MRRSKSVLVSLLAALVLIVGGSGIYPVSASSPAAPALSNANLSVVSIAGGFEHTCVLLADGTVRCWGSDRYGQLANVIQTIHPVPIPVALTKPATQITAGAYFTCALLNDGTVWCWGRNSEGELGNTPPNPSPTSPPANSNSPVQVLGVGGTGVLTSISAISAGYSSTCAITTAGAVVCGGDNSAGQ